MTSMTSPWYMAKAQVFLLACVYPRRRWREARIAQGVGSGAGQVGGMPAPRQRHSEIH
jgi:hypothetical protein